MTLKFTDSPPPGRAKFDLAPILAELKANPGKWAMVEKISFVPVPHYRGENLPAEEAPTLVTDYPESWDDPVMPFKRWTEPR